MNELMKDGKEEIVSNLYTLRAGLSVISQEKDKAQKKLALAKNNREKSLKKAKGKKSNFASELDLAEKNLDKAINTRDKNLSKANQSLNPIDNKGAVIRIIKATLCVMLEIFFILLFVWSFVIWLVAFGVFGENYAEKSEVLRILYGWYSINLVDVTWWGILITLASPIISIILSVLGFKLLLRAYKYASWKMSSIVETKKSNNKIKKERSVANSNIGKYEQNVIKAQGVASEKNDKYQLACEVYESECQEIEKKFEEDKEKAFKHVVAGMEMYEALQDTFSKQLDARDWENVDLIIYHLETGRADTVKEALQLTDREKQTERIEQAMSRATQEISRQIVEGVNYLEKYIGKCTSMLSDHLTNCATTLLKQNASIEMNRIRDMANLQSYVSDLSSQVRMNNALRAKANESSAKLVEDVHGIRELAAGHKIY